LQAQACRQPSEESCPQTAEESTLHFSEEAMTPADLTALEAELRHGAETLDEGSTGWPGAYKRAADAIADLRRKLDEARKMAARIRRQDRVTRFRGTEDQFYEDGPCGKIARRWMEDK
jgi:hypothetical protein